MPNVIPPDASPRPDVAAMPATRRGVFARDLWFLAGFAASYAVCVGLLVRKSTAWLDEVFTLTVTQAPDLTTMWERLRTGPMVDPPLYYLAVRVASWPSGVGLTAQRLPSVVGVFAGCLALYGFAARRVPAAYARIAALAPLALLAGLAHATDGRPYGLWLGWSALALFCWQSAAEGRGRLASLLGLALILSCGVTTHYYGVLVAAAVGLGELARVVERRRVDLGVLAALAAPGAALLACRPLFSAARDHVPTSWTPPNLVQLHDTYGHFGDQTTVLLLVGLMVVAVSSVLAPGGLATGRPAPWPGGEWSAGPRRYEVAAVLAYTAIPQMGVVLGVLLTNHMLARYVLPTLCGLALLLAFTAYVIGAGRPATGHAMTLLVAFVVLINFKNLYHQARQPPSGAALAQAVAARPDPSAPVLTTSPLFLEYTYNRPNLDARYLILGVGDAQLANRRARPWVNARMVEADELPELGRFYVMPSLCGEDVAMFAELSRRGVAFSAPIPTPGGGSLYLGDAARLPRHEVVDSARH